MYMKKHPFFSIVLAGIFLAGSVEAYADLISEHYSIIKKKRYKKRRYHRKHRHKKHRTKKKTATSAVGGATAIYTLTQEQQWQTALHWLGFYKGETDGNLYSFDTHKAIADFQKMQGVKSTGFLDEESKAYLSYIYNVSVLGGYLGYTGTDEKRRTQKYQTALKILGFYHGKIDGVIGENTKKTILDYKMKYGLSTDGADLSDREKYTLIERAKKKLTEEYRAFRSNNRLSREQTTPSPQPVSVSNTKSYEYDRYNTSAPKSSPVLNSNAVQEPENPDEILSDIDAFLNEEEERETPKKRMEDAEVAQKPDTTLYPSKDSLSEHMSDITTQMSQEAEQLMDTH
jgi:peptidoglycan hydrolase-like protein with peptidoglycan-binding domain